MHFRVTYSPALPRSEEFSRTLSTLTGAVPGKQGQFWLGWDSWSPTYLQNISVREASSPI